jgi:dihydrofolate reductase
VRDSSSPNNIARFSGIDMINQLKCSARAGFERGGWALPQMDEVIGKVMGEGISSGGALLLGRRTYEDFHGYWPKQKDNPFTEVLNKVQKYVVSTTLKGPLPWSNSTLLEGDAAKTIAKLKKEPGKDLGVLGSGNLVQTLMQHNLVDRYQLLIHPLVLGSGHRLFGSGSPFATLKLVESVVSTTGVVIATYQPKTSTKE